MMKIKIILFSLVVIYFNASPSLGTTWQTISPGYWNQGGMWMGGVVPPYSSSDTFLIKHPIVLGATLTLNSSAYLQIDSTGGICGHQKITVYTNAKILKYGILELDTLDIPGGIVNCVAPGSVVLTHNAFVTVTGADFTVNGCSLAVGPWFDCLLPEYNFTLGIKNMDVAEISISYFPNPNSGEFTIAASENLIGKTLQLFSMQGQKVFQIRIASSHTLLNLSGLDAGVYYSNALSGSSEKITIFKTMKLVIIK